MVAELLTWFKQARSTNIAISQPFLKEKCEEIAKNMDICLFKWVN